MTDAKKSAFPMPAILVLVATLATIAVNALAAAGYIGGVTPEAISGKHETVMTPSGYAFSIWSLIYVGITAFSIYQLLPSNAAKFAGIRWLYIASCVLNCAWIVCWHGDLMAACFAIIFLLFANLFLINKRLKNTGTFRDSLLSKAPFGLYFGWVTVAMLVNAFIFFTTLGIDPFNRGLAIALIVIAAAYAVLIRWRLTNFIYPLAVAWGLAAIAVKQSGNTPVVLAAAFATVTCLVTAGSVVTILKDSTSEQR